MVVRHYSGGGSSHVEWDCTHQAALPPVCVADDHLPSALQHAKIVFFLKEHSLVRLFKDELGLASDNVSPVRFWMRVVAWRWVMVTIAASRA